VKFYNFSTGAPGVNFYANDTKLTAITSTTGAESTTGVAQSTAQFDSGDSRQMNIEHEACRYVRRLSSQQSFRRCK